MIFSHSNQDPFYLSPSQLFKALGKLSKSRKLLTPTELSEITKIPMDRIDPWLQGRPLPHLIDREDGFGFLWRAMMGKMEK